VPFPRVKEFGFDPLSRKSAIHKNHVAIQVAYPFSARSEAADL
jgi:hypothetical protein